MEVLFDNNMIVVFIFFLINILGYSEIKFIEQRICIAYTIIFIMRALNIIGIALAIMLNLLTIMVYVEILTEDKMKLKLLTQIKYIFLQTWTNNFICVSFKYAITLPYLARM